MVKKEAAFVLQLKSECSVTKTNHQIPGSYIIEMA
jgi:hypothetical protein